MPSRLPSRTPKDLFYKRERVKQFRPVDVQVGGKFRGYEPDQRGLRQTWDGFRQVVNLLPIADYLQTNDGFVWADKNVAASPSLPLGTSTLPSTHPQPVVGLVEWTSLNTPGTPPYLIAATAKTTDGAGRLFYRADATAAWAALALQGGETDPAADHFLASTERVLHDMAVFPPGAPGRATVGAAITTPIVVWCTGYDLSAGAEPATGVLVIRGSTPTYALLTSDLASGDAHFAAASCTEFQDRMVFAATREAGVPYPYRVRWSIVGDASKITAASPGAGALDLVEFRTQLQRVLPIGDTLAVYSGDGVAFLSRTGRATDPFQRRYVTKTRGLLGPQAVCAIGRDMHLGIFTDGWYTLGQSGDWNRVGLDDSGGTRWDREFYSQLNYARRSQIALGYDEYRQVVRISFVAGPGSTQPNTQWNLDLRTNTIWPTTVGADFAPTYWGTAKQIYSSSAITWETVVGTWDTVTGFWSDYARETEDIPAPVFGTSLGMVYQVYYGSVLQAFRLVNTTGVPVLGGRVPSWVAESHRLPAAQIGQLSIPDKLWLNYEDLGPTTVQLGFTENEDSRSLQTVPIGGVTPNLTQSAYSSHRASMRQIAWYVSGSGAARIRGLRAQTLPTSAEQIRQQGT